MSGEGRLKSERSPEMTGEITSKADVLKNLYGKLKYSRIEKMRIVTGGEFERDPYSMAKDIGGEFGAGKIVVRSSSSNEDGMNLSLIHI